MTDSQLRELIAQTFKGIEELKQVQQKAEERIKKTEEHMQRTEEQMQRTEEQMRKTDEEIKKTEEQMRRTNEEVKRIAKMVGGIANNQGAITEEFFYNSLKHKQELGGIKYDMVYKNISGHKGKVEDEFDILMINGKDVAIIETKYKANEKDLEKLLTKKYRNFKELFPMYKDYNHHLVLASFHINEDLKQKAIDCGVTVLQRRGKMIETFGKN